MVSQKGPHPGRSDIVISVRKQVLFGTKFLKFGKCFGSKCYLGPNFSNLAQKRANLATLPPSYHLNSKNSKNSIKFVPHLQLQYKLCGLINSLLLLRHTAYPLTRRSHNNHQVLATVSQLWCFKVGVSKLQPAGQSGPQSHFIRLTKSFHATRDNILSIMKIFLRKTYWFGRLWHIPKQSHYVKRPAHDVG